MKALVLEEYNNLVFKNVPDPVLGSKDVLIEVKACGICGSDVHGLDGSTGRRIPPLITPITEYLITQIEALDGARSAIDYRDWKMSAFSEFFGVIGVLFLVVVAAMFWMCVAISKRLKWTIEVSGQHITLATLTRRFAALAIDEIILIPVTTVMKA